ATADDERCSTRDVVMPQPVHSGRNVIFFFQAEDGIRDGHVTGVQTCALPILYSFEEPLVDKIKKAAQKIYGADGVKFSEAAGAKLKQFPDWGYGKLPVCMAKTQYSLSDNPKLLGAPSGWTLNVTSASLSAGAGFV